MVDLARKTAKEKTVAEIQADPATQTKFQIKTLSADYNTNNTDVSELTFNNLTVGKVYKLTGKVKMILDSATTNLQLHIKDGANDTGNWIDIVLASENGAAGDQEKFNAVSALFVAQTSNVYFNLRSVTGDDRLVGNGDREETYFVLEELPNHVQTSDFT